MDSLDKGQMRTLGSMAPGAMLSVFVLASTSAKILAHSVTDWP